MAKRTKNLILARLIVLMVINWFPGAAVSAPKAELWERWQTHDPKSTQQIDHSSWGAFLSRYLSVGRDDVNRLAYGTVTPEDRKKLEVYIAALERTPVSRLNRKEQLAYWINLYNALTVKVVLDHYPIESIRDVNISPGWFVRGPWGKKLVTVEGEKISLDDIEHRILRPIWRDPRIHYAVNCASFGCPNLAPTPYTAETVDAMLTQGGFRYVNHPRGVSITENGLLLSSIYNWFQEDFGGTDAAVIQHLKEYAFPRLGEKLNGFKQIHDFRYDWRLNEGKPDKTEKKSQAF